MTLLGVLILLLVGALCGALAELIVGFSAGGFFTSAAVGFAGAFIGSAIARALQLPAVLVINVERVGIDVVWAVVGAALLLGIVSIFRRRTVHVRDSYV